MCLIRRCLDRRGEFGFAFGSAVPLLGGAQASFVSYIVPGPLRMMILLFFLAMSCAAKAVAEAATSSKAATFCVSVAVAEIRLKELAPALEGALTPA